jgi:hypothetical protein
VPERAGSWQALQMKGPFEWQPEVAVGQKDPQILSFNKNKCSMKVMININSNCTADVDADEIHRG